MHMGCPIQIWALQIDFLFPMIIQILAYGWAGVNSIIFNYFLLYKTENPPVCLSVDDTYQGSIEGYRSLSMTR